METKHFNKMLSSKDKDKEVYNLTAKASNQEETIANIKVSNNKFKNDIKKLNRSLKQKQIEANPVYSCYICGKPLKKVEDMKEHVDEDHSDILSKSEYIAPGKCSNPEPRNHLLPNTVKDITSEFPISENNINLFNATFVVTKVCSFQVCNSSHGVSPSYICERTLLRCDI